MIYLKFALAALLTTSAASMALAGPAYRRLDGWGYVGYKERVTKDGYWRIVTNSQGEHGAGFALRMALYRAASLSKDGGHRYF